jgi:hypothetical protein
MDWAKLLETVGVPNNNQADLSVTDNHVSVPGVTDKAPNGVPLWKIGPGRISGGQKMSAADDGGVHEPQQPKRSPASERVPEGALARGCFGAILGGLCGAVSSLLTFPIVFFVCAQVNPNIWWAVIFIVYAPFVGAGVGAIFGAALLAAKGSFE